MSLLSNIFYVPSFIHGQIKFTWKNSVWVLSMTYLEKLVETVCIFLCSTKSNNVPLFVCRYMLLIKLTVPFCPWYIPKPCIVFSIKRSSGMLLNAFKFLTLQCCKMSPYYNKVKVLSSVVLSPLVITIVSINKSDFEFPSSIPLILWLGILDL